MEVKRDEIVREELKILKLIDYVILLDIQLFHIFKKMGSSFTSFKIWNPIRVNNSPAFPFPSFHLLSSSPN